MMSHAASDVSETQGQAASISPATDSVRVLLCEDHEIYRIGLRVLIDNEPDLIVVGEILDLKAASVFADRVDAHVIILRQGMLAAARKDALIELCRSGREVLILAESESEADLADALRTGVRGYMSRWVSAARLLEGIRALTNNEPALDAAYARHLLRFLTDNSSVGAIASTHQPSSVDQLTERQLAVAVLVAQGMSNNEIAATLFVSHATVKSHITAVLKRLGLRSRVQLAILMNERRDAVSPG